MVARSLEEILMVNKNLDDLNIVEAILYLNSIGMKMAVKNLQCRMSSGNGPRSYKRNNRVYFKMHDLDAFKKNETKVKEAYSRSA